MNDLGSSVYLVESYWPGVTSDAIRNAIVRLRKAAAATSGAARVQHLGSGFVPGDEYVFWLFGADSLEAVAAVNRNAGISFDRVVPAWLSIVDTAR